MHLEIVPFRDEHVDAAAPLLASRHQADRQVEPALPAQFERSEVARNAIEAIWRRPRAEGVIAFLSGRAVGYLLGTPTIDLYRGRTVWSPMAGHAVDGEFGPELYRDLYAALSPRWLEGGYFEHYVLVPATDRPALDAWFSLSFGLEQVYAIRELAGSETAALVKETALEIRQATLDDKEQVLQLAEVIGRHQAGSPVYAPFLPENADELREGFTELLSDPDATLWLAFKDRQVLGYQLQVPAKTMPENLLVPEHCTELAVAATLAQARGQGIGHALTDHALSAAQKMGFTYCVTDWRTTNLLSSRFWPRLGFRPAYYRLRRLIDQRIVWASGRD